MHMDNDSVNNDVLAEPNSKALDIEQQPQYPNLTVEHTHIGLVINPISVDPVVPDTIVESMPEKIAPQQADSILPQPSVAETIYTSIDKKSTSKYKKLKLFTALAALLIMTSVVTFLSLSYVNNDQTVVVAESGVITSGPYNSCYIDISGKVYCWGSNSTGELGDGSNKDSSTPVPVNMSGVLKGKTAKILAGGSGAGRSFSCLIASDDLPYCWGENYYGQLGNNSTEESNVPVAVDMSGALKSKTVKSISVGSSHACVIASDDNAYCWGEGSDGQLGNDTGTSSVPIAVNREGVLAGKTIKSITSGSVMFGGYSCVIASDNNEYCWGNNSSGQLGDGTIISRFEPVAVDVSGVLKGKTIKKINGSCAIASDDQIYCWGSDNKGDGLTKLDVTPVAVNRVGVLAKESYIAISGSCALDTLGRVLCWGLNGNGRIGDGTTITSTIPVFVDMSGAMKGSKIKSIYNDDAATACAISTENKVYCWGGSIPGQSGDVHSPIQFNIQPLKNGYKI